MIATETATVYRGARRRFLTRKAAERDIAKHALKQRCECDEPIPHEGYPGHTCALHGDAARYERMLHLLIVMFVRKPSQEDAP